MCDENTPIRHHTPICGLNIFLGPKQPRRLKNRSLPARPPSPPHRLTAHYLKQPRVQISETVLHIVLDLVGINGHGGLRSRIHPNPSGRKSDVNVATVLFRFSPLDSIPFPPIS